MECKKCNKIVPYILKPGKGPHAFKCKCAICGRFIKWVSIKNHNKIMKAINHA